MTTISLKLPEALLREIAHEAEARRVGKSAVIGRAVALSDPDFREALERTTRWSSDVAERQGTLPPANGIDAAVHLRGLTATGVAQRVTEILDLEPAGGDLLEDFVEQVLRGKDGNRRPTIVLDALDEAEEPRLIAERIVRPLVAAGCAVVIGTRPSAASHGLPNVLDLLGEGLRVDLSDDDSSEADIADYIDSRLTAADGPYAGDRALRRAISDAVTSRAQRQFLYAKLTTDELMAEPIASVAELELALTRSVGLAFARTLARLDAEFGQAFETAEPGATALALGLAWGEGLGVPVRNQIWPVVAQAVSRSPMLLTDEHCRWFFRKAGSYVLESGENEQAVYRLYHEALHEHLRQVTVDADSARRRIGMALFEHLRENGGWALANPYAVRHVPTSLDGETIMHLVAVCTDPFYLARALDVLGVDDTARLLDHVQRAAPNPALIATAKAVRRSRVALAHQASELAPQLIARLGSESDHALRRLVDTAKQVAPPIWLEPVNLRLEWSTELQTTQTLPGKVRSLAVWDMGADPRLFVGAGSSIVTWDARNGGVDRSFGNDDLRPLALAAGLLGSQDVVASGSYEGLAAVRDARTGALVAPRIVTGVTAWSVAVAPAPKHIPPEVEHEFSYAEHVWGRVLQLDGTCLYWSDLPNHLWVLDGRLAVVHETDDGFAVRTEGTDYEVHFAVERGLLPHEPVLAVANHLGQTHLAIAEDERTVRIIDPDGGSSVVQFNFPVRCLVLTWVGPEPVVAAANDSDRMFGTASYVSVRQPRAAVVPTEEDTTGRRLVGIAIQSGRLVGLRQDDWIIDIETGDGAWDPDATDLALVAGVRRPFEADRTAEDGMQDWPILSVGWASIDGQDVQIHGSTEGVVWLVDRERAVRAFGPAAPTSPARTPRRNPMAKGRELQSVRAVCAGTVAGHRQLARADAAGVILYDIDTGQSRPGPEVGQSRLSAMAFGSSGRRSLLATGSDGGGVAIWDCADWRRLTGFTLDDPITGIWLSESSVVVETDTMRPALFRLHGAATSNRT